MNQQAIPQQTCELTFNDVSDDLASRYASGLQDWLLDARSDIKVTRMSNNVGALDLGSVLEITIPAVASIAAAVSTVVITYIKSNRASVRVTRGNRTVVIGPFRDEEKAIHALKLFLQGLDDDKQNEYIQQ